MYKDFYGLKEKPFDLTPSPHYLYLGEIHKEALALLTYGVMERKGFVLLTGEVGAGKTTIVKTLLAGLDENVQCVYLSNPRLSAAEFLEYLALSVFEEKHDFKSKARFLLAFEKYLLQAANRNKNFILIVDEAQNVSYSMLEDIRLLSNLETAGRGLFSIFLVGQPELNWKLSLPICLPVQQRISMRYHIKPLDLKATREYVVKRLQTAGMSNGVQIFSKQAVDTLHRFSEGYPRMINVLADNALLLGYSTGRPKITRAMVKDAFRDTLVESAAAGRARTAYRRVAALLAALLLLAAALSTSPAGRDLLGAAVAKLGISIPWATEESTPGKPSVLDQNQMIRKKIENNQNP